MIVVENIMMKMGISIEIKMVIKSYDENADDGCE